MQIFLLNGIQPDRMRGQHLWRAARKVWLMARRRIGRKISDPKPLKQRRLVLERGCRADGRIQKKEQRVEGNWSSVFSAARDWIWPLIGLGINRRANHFAPNVYGQT